MTYIGLDSGFDFEKTLRGLDLKKAFTWPDFGLHFQRTLRGSYLALCWTLFRALLWPYVGLIFALVLASAWHYFGNYYWTYVGSYFGLMLALTLKRP